MGLAIRDPWIIPGGGGVMDPRGSVISRLRIAHRVKTRLCCVRAIPVLSARVRKIERLQWVSRQGGAGATRIHHICIVVFSSNAFVNITTCLRL